MKKLMITLAAGHSNVFHLQSMRSFEFLGGNNYNFIVFYKIFAILVLLPTKFKIINHIYNVSYMEITETCFCRLRDF